MTKSILVFAVTLFVSLNANAFLELRLQGAYHIINPSDFNNFLTGTLNAPPINSGFDEVKQFITYGADGIVKVPMIPVGLGLRYEALAIPKQESSGSSLEFSTSRISILANYRLIDSYFWAGPIVSLGLMHTLNLDIAAGPASVDISKFDSLLSYSLGFEGGISLGMFLLGGEVGYMSWNFQGLKDGDGNKAAFDSFDLSGLYLKLLLGLSF